MTSLLKYRTRIPEIYGTFIALGLIFYFLISYLTGFVQIVELRLFNLAILVCGIYFALKQFKETHQDHLNYFQALVTGIASATIGISTFVVFLFIMFQIDHSMFEKVVKNAPMGQYLDAYIATFAVWIEGIFSGFMATFILINFIHTDR